MISREEAIRITDAVIRTYNSIAHHFSQSRWKLWEDLNYFTPFLRDGQSILEIGCGNGRLLELLGDRQMSYRGVDASAMLIEQAKRQPHQLENSPQFEVANVLQLDLGETFDVVMLVAVLQHFPRALHDDVMERVAAHVKQGGYLLMTNWNMWQRSYYRLITSQLLLKRVTARNRVVYGVPYRRWGMRDVLVPYQQNADRETLQERYLYAFTRRELRLLLERHGFALEMHTYTDKYARAPWWRGRNILTIARKIS